MSLVVLGQPHDLQPVADRGQRVSQFVREDCQELALAAARLPFGLFGPLAVGDVHEDVHRPDQVTGLVVNGVGVRQDRAPAPVRAFDDDFSLVESLVLSERQSHPALAMRHR
jgi:hypothetical protein